MSQFFIEYGLFLAKTVTLIVGILVVIGQVVRAAVWARQQQQWQLRVRPLNDRFKRLARTLQAETLSRKEWKQLNKQDHAEHKQREKKGVERARVYVLGFEGDMRASAVRELREEITAVLAVARPQDEVFLRLESGGGMVHSYGLAASQLVRLKQHKVKLTVAVDGIAASGGYMMACVADHIVAAPFAILGSIGVVAQLPNFNRLLKKHDVDIELHTAGEYKRTLTILGENTNKGREKFKEELEQTHDLFKAYVLEQRKKLNISAVATGEHWYGLRAIELGLCDEINTSDAWLTARAEAADLFEVKYIPSRRMSERVTGFAGRLQDAMLDRLLARSQRREV